MEAETEDAILKAVARGDEGAFAELYDRIAPVLHALAFQLLGSESEAAEALQDGLLDLWEQAADFEPGRLGAFAWCVTRFRNRVVDRLRASHRRIRFSAAGAEGVFDLAEREEDPGSAAARARRALRSLPDEQRQCLEWAYVRGLTHLQLAEGLSAPVAQVKSSIRRGLGRLRDLLGEGDS